MRKGLFIIGPLALGILYFSLLPLFIQGGDTAELVNASYHLFVPHPPGYPLFTWLEFSWMHLFQISTVFWRASALSALFSLSALLLIVLPLRKNFWLTLLPCVTLGLNKEFLESALLPDVFSLHALFTSLFLFIYFFCDKTRRFFLLPFIFAVSAANHHTTIFLLPCLVMVFREAKKASELKKSFMGLGIGGVICFALYGTLLLMKPLHPLSWGELTNFTNLISHILRVDYGTFKLAGQGSGSFGEAFLYLLKSLLPFIPLFILSLLKLRAAKFLAVGGSIVLTFLFSLMMNVSSDLSGEEILKRFHLMPLILIMFFIIYFLKNTIVTKKMGLTLALLILPILAVNGRDLPGFMGLRHDSIIEDYSRTMYREALEHSPVIIVADGDSSFFGLRYIQAFEGKSTDKVVAITAPLLFNAWFEPKISTVLPEFKLPDSEKIRSKRLLNTALDVVKPNLGAINFIVTKDYREGDWYKVRFMKLGRLVSEGSGVSFDLESESKLSPPPFFGPQHFTKGYLFYQYAHYYLAQAGFFWGQDNINSAKDNWERALKVVPYAAPAMENLCQVSKKDYKFCRTTLLHKMKIKSRGFY